MAVIDDIKTALEITGADYDGQIILYANLAARILRANGLDIGELSATTSKEDLSEQAQGLYEIVIDFVSHYAMILLDKDAVNQASYKAWYDAHINELLYLIKVSVDNESA